MWIRQEHTCDKGRIQEHACGMQTREEHTWFVDKTGTHMWYVHKTGTHMWYVDKTEAHVCVDKICTQLSHGDKRGTREGEEAHKEHHSH